MTTEKHKITVNGLPVDIVRKDIKNLHLGVYPPHGRVRVAAPLRVSDNAVRLAVIGKLGWIRRQRAKFDSQRRQSEREMVSGETHYFLGQRYRLRVISHNGPGKVIVRNGSTMELHVRRELNSEQRERVLQRWYRRKLRELIPPLLEKWQRALNVPVSEWAVKKMKTKWGACNNEAGRIWLNLELAKKPAQCLEYIIVHELIHLLERHHNDTFTHLMNQFLPQWRSLRSELNAAPLAHATWSY
ncbi:MAG TPA: SprT family zinc-dependent metalloprotease [Candidatus Binatia bacterium]